MVVVVLLPNVFNSTGTSTAAAAHPNNIKTPATIFPVVKNGVGLNYKSINNIDDRNFQLTILLTWLERQLMCLHQEL